MNRSSEWTLDEWRTYQKIAAGIHAVNDELRVELEYDYPIHGGGSKEVDVVVWDNSARYEHITLIECKSGGNPVPQKVVDSKRCRALSPLPQRAPQSAERRTRSEVGRGYSARHHLVRVEAIALLIARPKADTSCIAPSGSV